MFSSQYSQSHSFIKPKSPSHRRGTEAPMDFEMDGSLAPDEDGLVWLKAANAIIPTKQIQEGIKSIPETIKYVSSKSQTKPSRNSQIKDFVTQKKNMVDEMREKDVMDSSSAASTLRKQSVEESLKSLTFNELLPRKRKKTLSDQIIDPDTRSYHGGTEKHRYSSSYTADRSRWFTTTIPHLIREYVHLFFTVTIVGMTLFIILYFILSVHHDLQMKADEYSREITKQIEECSKHYLDNRCEPSQRTPALETLCREWEVCMLRDPAVVGRLQVGAETLAEILNKLIEPLSYKAMIFGSVLILGSIWLTSSAWSLHRIRNDNHHPWASQLQPMTSPLPITPSIPVIHHPSYGYMTSYNHPFQPDVTYLHHSPARIHSYASPPPYSLNHGTNVSQFDFKPRMTPKLDPKRKELHDPLKQRALDDAADE